ncbi:MAG: Rne/Rng family ribonuclease [Clostridia bacterium]|nr:Rne/Rng family ribonuclease [Clostridia bacterium]
MAKKTLYFDSRCGMVAYAVTENGKLTEFNYEKTGGGVAVGNVYKGRVESVLQGMQAAFISCGLERNCYVSAEDTAPDSSKYESAESYSPAFPELKEGDEVLVQIVKPPVGNKGARVTTLPSFIGKSLIYMPLTPFIGVSRKIADGELRRNLAYSAGNLLNKGEGVIVRTAAPYAKREHVETELDFLRNLYSGVCERFENAEVGELLYTDFDLPVRVLRDTLINDVEKIIVGTKELEKNISALVNMFPTTSRRPVVLYTGARDMLDEAGVTEQIYELTSPRVDLENGAYLVIEKTEALTVIDVNTGKFTGDYNLEQTVYHTNILAAREIARQVKLRNIGGIIVVDFIDMQSAAHKKALCEELERALKKDKAKCSVSPVSKLGLVEFSRKRTGSGPLPLMVGRCRHCRGTGLVNSAEFTLFGMRAKILKLAADGEKILRADMNAEVFEKLVNWKELIEDIRAVAGAGIEVFAVPHRSYEYDKLNLRASSSVEFSILKNAVKIL